MRMVETASLENLQHQCPLADVARTGAVSGDRADIRSLSALAEALQDLQTWQSQTGAETGQTIHAIDDAIPHAPHTTGSPSLDLTLTMLDVWLQRQGRNPPLPTRDRRSGDIGRLLQMLARTMAKNTGSMIPDADADHLLNAPAAGVEEAFDWSLDPEHAGSDDLSGFLPTGNHPLTHSRQPAELPQFEGQILEQGMSQKDRLDAGLHGLWLDLSLRLDQALKDGYERHRVLMETIKLGLQDIKASNAASGEQIRAAMRGLEHQVSILRLPCTRHWLDKETSATQENQALNSLTAAVRRMQQPSGFGAPGKTSDGQTASLSLPTGTDENLRMKSIAAMRHAAPAIPDNEKSVDRPANETGMVREESHQLEAALDERIDLLKLVNRSTDARWSA